MITNLPDYLRDFARFAYLTGMRKGEATSLSWKDVQGDVIELRAENAKNGEARAVLLEGEPRSIDRAASRCPTGEEAQ